MSDICDWCEGIATSPSSCTCGFVDAERILPEKLTFRPGSLAKPMAKRMKADGIGASELIRRALAAYLDAPKPRMDGHKRQMKRINEERKR